MAVTRRLDKLLTEASDLMDDEDEDRFMSELAIGKVDSCSNNTTSLSPAMASPAVDNSKARELQESSNATLTPVSQLIQDVESFVCAS